VKEGVKLSLTLITNAGNKSAAKILGALVQDQLGQTGIQIMQAIRSISAPWSNSCWARPTTW
jgi:hypothetical protein